MGKVGYIRGMRWVAFTIILTLGQLAGCVLLKPDSSAFDQGEYRIIHGQSYLCIQPDAEAHWKEKCKHTKTGEVIEVEKMQISTQNP